MKSVSYWGSLLTMSLVLVACGGGGGGDLGGTTTPNPPSAESAQKVVVAGKSLSVQINATGSNLSFSISQPPTKGSATVTSTGLVNYTPNALASGKTQDSLTVSVSNAGGTATAVVGFEIYAPLDASNDPLSPYQWHLANTGQDVFSTTRPVAGVDLNVAPAWAQTFTGKNVTVNVVDSGLEIAHPDLAANVTPGASVNFGGGNDPTNNTDTTGDHGTSVAGLIAMVGNNGIGGQGVAYDAKLMGHNYLGGNGTQYQSIANLGTAYTASADVFNASYGYGGCLIFAPNSSVNSIYANVKTLRAGYGGVVVKSAGNGFDKTATCNPNLVKGVSNNNSEFDSTNVVDNLVVVAAVNAKGVKSSYSSTGANIWVSGLGGEFGLNSTTLGYDLINNGSAVYAEPAMITTDQSGCNKGWHTNKASVNGVPKSHNEFEKEGSATQTSLNVNCNYTSTFNGTSSAAPTVSGVVALMLEANPNLTWRDVKHILASTAKKVDAGIAPAVTSANNSGSSVKKGITVEQAWVTNAAGFHFHNWYGFGLVDAGAAVSMAKTLTPLGPERTSLVSSTVTVPVGTPVKLPIANQPVTQLETAEIALDLSGVTETGTGAPYSSCFQFELTSPSGTKSILLNAGSGYIGSSSQFTLLSNAFYGEVAAGNWKFQVNNICTTGDSLVTNNVNITLTLRGR